MKTINYNIVLDLPCNFFDHLATSWCPHIILNRLFRKIFTMYVGRDGTGFIRQLGKDGAFFCSVLAGIEDVAVCLRVLHWSVPAEILHKYRSVPAKIPY